MMLIRDHEISPSPKSGGTVDVDGINHAGHLLSLMGKRGRLHSTNAYGGNYVTNLSREQKIRAVRSSSIDHKN